MLCTEQRNTYVYLVESFSDFDEILASSAYHKIFLVRTNQNCHLIFQDVEKTRENGSFLQSHKSKLNIVETKFCIELSRSKFKIIAMTIVFHRMLLIRSTSKLSLNIYFRDVFMVPS